MAFSISGRIAGGMDDALSDVLDRRMKEAVRAQQEKHQNDIIQVQREQMAQTAADRVQDNARQQRVVDLNELIHKDTIDRLNRTDAEKATDKATAKNAMSDMAAVLQMPGLTQQQRSDEIMGSGLRTNTVDPQKVIENLNRVPTKPTLHQVTVRGPDGRPMTKWITDEEAVKGVNEYVKPDKPQRENLTPGQSFQATRQLRNDYQRETVAAKTTGVQLADMRDSMTAYREGKQAAGAQGVLVTFQKILDPTSVVRESEYARSASGQAVMSQLQGLYEKLTAGGAGVPADELQKFVDLAERYSANVQRSAKDSRRQVDAIADEFGLNKANITRDFDIEEQQPPPVKPGFDIPPPTVPGVTPPGSGRMGYGDYARPPKK